MRMVHLAVDHIIQQPQIALLVNHIRLHRTTSLTIVTIKWHDMCRTFQRVQSNNSHGVSVAEDEELAVTFAPQCLALVATDL